MKKIIIFDFDGVVVTGSNEGYFNCYHQALESVGVRLKPEEERKRILSRWGQSHEREIEALLQEHPELISDAVKKYEELFETEAFTGKITLIEGAKEALDELSQNFILTIATGTNRKTVEELLEKYDIQYFKKIVSSYEIENHEDQKPSPYSVNLILNEFRFKPEEAVVIGDGGSDVKMAQGAGVEPIVVLTGHLSKNEAVELGVKHIVPSIKELPQIISSI